MTYCANINEKNHKYSIYQPVPVILAKFSGSGDRVKSLIKIANNGRKRIFLRQDKIMFRC